MWIESLEIGGFRQLRGSFTLGRGLTIVHGPNESGKTALQEAFLRALFGFSASERRMRNGVSVLTHARPWTGSPFGLTALVHEAQEGRSLRIAWDFDEHSVSVQDSDTGSDFSNEVRGQRQDVVLGEWLLGLELDDYRQACCLFQVAVGPVVHSDGLVGALRTAVEQGAHEGGVTAADELLKSFLGTRLGLNSRWYTPLGGGELSRADRELEDATAALAAAHAAREQIWELAQEYAGCEQELGAKTRELLEVEQRLLLTDRVELRRRSDEAERQRARIEKRPERPVSVVPEQRDRVAALRSQIERDTRRVTELEADVAAGAPGMSALANELREVTVSRDRLQPYADWDTRLESRVRELQAQLDLLDRQDAEPLDAPPPRDPGLARFRAERERLQERAAHRDGPRWRRSAVLAAIAVAALSAVGAVFSPAALIGLILAAIILLLARHDRIEPGDGTLAVALRDFGAESLEELERWVEEEDRSFATAEGRRQERDQQKCDRAEKIAGLQSELRDALRSTGVAIEDPLSEAVSGYLAGCDQQAGFTQLDARVAALSGELLGAREPQRDLDTRRRELAQLEVTLRRAYAETGIDESDLDRAEAAYQALLAQAHTDEAILADTCRAEEALRVALAGQTIDQLQTALKEVEAQLRGHVAQHGHLAQDPGDRAELNGILSSRRQETDKVAREVAALAARIRERESASGDPAAIEEHIALLGSRRQRLEQAGHAVRIAREGLAAAAREAHRAFAPHLNSALARELPRVTGGRYTSATVGDALEIKVIAPETGILVDFEVLSRGTQDQIALVERLAVARMLDPTTGRAPLFLDDPFGHTDPARRIQALDLITELASTRQIILTTEDPNLVELAERFGRDLALIELSAPCAPNHLRPAEQAA